MLIYIMNMVIYIIEALDSENFKIGFTKNIDRRVKELQTSSAFKLEVKYTYESEFATKIESKIHKSYSHLRLNGEWFKLDYDILEIIIKDIERTHSNLKFLKENKI